VGWFEDKIEEKLGDLAATVSLEGDKTRTEMAAALGQSIRGLRINGARPRPISPNAANVSAGGRLVGWSVRASGGTVALTFHDGNDATGDVIGATALLADGASETHSVMPAGIAFVQSLYVEVTGTGVPVGALWFGAVD
jgi:hypothetical protein